MIKKLLIANRGEIARRIMKTCRQMGISTVAVYSDADKDALFVKEADEAIALGGLQAAESYLLADKLIAAVKTTNADAIHPGYGFLSENAEFAKFCANEGITFVGPNPEAIASMGDKKTAKNIVKGYDVPVIPGYDGDDQSPEKLIEEANKIGFPVLLKATAGGGGKGMRIVREAKELDQAIEAAKREAKNAFGNDAMLLEKYFDSSKHIEFQIFGDKHGNVLHLYERECSIQRRYQKIIEESPSPALTPELREEMAAAAVNAAKSINYDNAGTVEFILSPEGKFYFLEVNTRLQVEHPVTEMVTGLDLVRLQIEVAQGAELAVKQEDIPLVGHAMECRLYAEDPYNDFLPATGTVRLFEEAPFAFARYDGGVETGSEISMYYDPMISKVIVWGDDREDAIRKMITTLKRTVLLGTTTNKDFLIDVLAHPDHVAGKFDTHFLDQHPELTERPADAEEKAHHLLIASLLYRWQARNSGRTLLKGLTPGWRNNFYAPQQEQYAIGEDEFTLKYRYENGKFHVHVGDHEHTAELLSVDGDTATLSIDGYQSNYTIATWADQVAIHHSELGSLQAKLLPRFPDNQADAEDGGYIAPMPGEVVKVMVKPGDKVSSGQPLLVLLSMKMENTIEAFEDGEVDEVLVTEKGLVEAGTVLLKMKD